MAAVKEDSKPATTVKPPPKGTKKKPAQPAQPTAGGSSKPKSTKSKQQPSPQLDVDMQDATVQVAPPKKSCKRKITSPSAVNTEDEGNGWEDGKLHDKEPLQKKSRTPGSTTNADNATPAEADAGEGGGPEGKPVADSTTITEEPIKAPCDRCIEFKVLCVKDVHRDKNRNLLPCKTMSCKPCKLRKAQCSLNGPDKATTLTQMQASLEELAAAQSATDTWQREMGATVTLMSKQLTGLQNALGKNNALINGIMHELESNTRRVNFALNAVTLWYELNNVLDWTLGRE